MPSGRARGAAATRLRSDSDPIRLFTELFGRARTAEVTDASAAALATADPSGRPSVRMVLLKDVDDGGFVFFTNYGSRKARDLEANPRAALCLHWPSLAMQVRVEGDVQRVPGRQSDDYFATRPRDSQLAAWTSRQSQPLESREELLDRYEHAGRRFAGVAVPRPPFWGGYRLRPSRIEFWTADERRLHERVCYHREPWGWRPEPLQP
jgi:pyridoxamine 5'-phosphate oxidase